MSTASTAVDPSRLNGRIKDAMATVTRNIVPRNSAIRFCLKVGMTQLLRTARELNFDYKWLALMSIN